MKTHILLSITFLVIIACTLPGYSQQSIDQRFASTAAEGGMLEVKLGELAMKKGSSKEVKDFGKGMITDHSKANNELKTLAKKKNITIPTSLSQKKQQQYDSLASMSGDKFDKVYMNMMLLSHEQTINLFETELNKGEDPEIKKWAGQKVPALKHHLQMANALFPALEKH
jgi:putative membrane protein